MPRLEVAVMRFAYTLASCILLLLELPLLLLSTPVAYRPGALTFLVLSFSISPC